MRTISSNCKQLLPFLSDFSNNLFYYQLLSIFPPYVRSLSFRGCVINFVYNFAGPKLITINEYFSI